MLLWCGGGGGGGGQGGWCRENGKKGRTESFEGLYSSSNAHLALMIYDQS